MRQPALLPSNDASTTAEREHCDLCCIALLNIQYKSELCCDLPFHVNEKVSKLSTGTMAWVRGGYVYD